MCSQLRRIMFLCDDRLIAKSMTSKSLRRRLATSGYRLTCARTASDNSWCSIAKVWQPAVPSHQAVTSVAGKTNRLNKQILQLDVCWSIIIMFSIWHQGFVEVSESVWFSIIRDARSVLRISVGLVERITSILQFFYQRETLFVKWFSCLLQLLLTFHQALTLR